jgi:uncharacterized protein YbjQ (UPF0145 family)
MNEALVLVVWLSFTVLVPLLFPTASWALGRWYQNRLMATLEENEKLQGALLQSEHHLSTSSPLSALTASSSTLLHVSLCVGPSMGQIFFMWVKSLFGGRLLSYDAVLDYGRREVLLRLSQQALAQGCTSMVNIRIETSTVSFVKNKNGKTSSVEFLAFATGLR